TDWMNDDQPYWYELTEGRLLAVPYNLETNDFTLALSARLAGPELPRGHRPFPPALARRRDAGAIGGDLHPLVHLRTAAPQAVRAGYLMHMKAREETWLTTSDAIYEWMAGQPTVSPPSSPPG